MNAPNVPSQRGGRPLRTLRTLVDAGLVTAEEIPSLVKAVERFAVGLTGDVAALIDPDDPGDPIARQYVPAAAELQIRPEERADPIGDARHTPLPGITHRYPDRLLLKPLLVCPVYCRFCFRREQVGPAGEVLDPAALDAALTYIAARPEIWEVILSGGDPLILSPARLSAILGRLRAISHVAVVRIHSRVPVVDPGRIDAAMVSIFRASAPVWVVIHVNHPRELTAAARAAIGRLADAGIPLLSQSVLLRGVNDDPDTLTALLRALVALRIKPYYLHHGDLAAGTSHLRTSLAEGQALMAALRGRVSGLCLPTYVLDLPGGAGKVPVGPAWIEEQREDGRCVIRDPRGERHIYPPTPEGAG